VYKDLTNDNIENIKADAKKAVADIGNKISHVEADASADVEKLRANFGHNEVGKKAAYAKADIKADVQKAKADIDKRAAHLKADAEKKKA
jgi:hypothetical protein